MADELWPADWADRMAGRGCAMCANQGDEDNGFGTRFHRGTYADVFLQRAEWSPGYSVAIWKHGHVAEPTQLTDEDAAGYWLDVVTAARLLQRHFMPAKMNYETLGNALPHLHTHLVPRYLGDPAPGRPLPFDLMALGRTVEANTFEAQLAALRDLR